MSTITRHAPGTFCWPELATSDQASAKKFYTSLFGWGVNDNDLGNGETYTILTNQGADVGALYTIRAEEKAAGAPPNWHAYVAVENADRATARAKELGGRIIMGPFDAAENGRMSIIADPQGAVFQVWQANKHPGAGKLGEPGFLCWTELMTTNARAAETFYTGLFPWKAEPAPVPPGAPPYTMFKLDGNGVGGMMQITPEMGKMPPHWLPYFAVTDCDATVLKAGSLGGKTMIPPTDIPNTGRFSILQDPQGAVFAIIRLMT